METGAPMENPAAMAPHDLAPQLLDRRQRLAAVARTRPGDEGLTRLLGEVDAALGRLESGSYGLCETCHEAIEEEQLERDPLGRFCLEHLSAPERRALEEDMEAAARIQRALLPRGATAVPGWDLASAFEPAGPVGGDFCVVLPHEGDGLLTFGIGDVSGKGIPAAMLAASLQATIQSLAGPGVPAGSLVERTNRVFRSSAVSRSFATLVCGHASADGALQLCNAGHWPPLLSVGGRVRELPPTGLPVGAFYSTAYGHHELSLAEGDFLLLYTDGLTEARDAQGVEYGPERLAALLAGLSPRTAADVVAVCLADLHAHAPAREDDLSLLVLRRTAAA